MHSRVNRLSITRFYHRACSHTPEPLHARSCAWPLAYPRSPLAGRLILSSASCWLFIIRSPACRYARKSSPYSLPCTSVIHSTVTMHDTETLGRSHLHHLHPQIHKCSHDFICFVTNATQWIQTPDTTSSHPLILTSANYPFWDHLFTRSHDHPLAMHSSRSAL